MLAGTWNIICEQGATFDWTIKSTDVNGNIIDLTGYTALMKVKTSRNDSCSSELIELSTENGKIILGGVLGTIRLLIYPADTTPLLAGQYYYDLFLNSANNSYKWIQGTFTVEGSISK